MVSIGYICVILVRDSYNHLQKIVGIDIYDKAYIPTLILTHFPACVKDITEIKWCKCKQFAAFRLLRHSNNFKKLLHSNGMCVIMISRESYKCSTTMRKLCREILKFAAINPISDILRIELPYGSFVRFCF